MAPLKSLKKCRTSDPDHYRKHRKKLAEGITRKRHSPSTKNNISGIQKRWIRHCEFLNEDSLKFLLKGAKEDIGTFLKWILDHYNIKKEKTLEQYWKQWRMLYRKYAGFSLHAQTMSEVTNYIHELADEYGLDLTPREKRVMNVDDIFIILHYHWALDTTEYADGRQRVQMALLMLISAYTGTRPGALVYVARNIKALKSVNLAQDADPDSNSEDEEVGASSLAEDVEAIKTICYEDITLLLLPDHDGTRDLLAMEVNLKYTKGHHRTPKRKIFVFSEVNDLVFDALILMISIAIVDHAFEANIQSVRQIFQLRVRAPRRSLHLKWKKSILKTPIFRQAVPSINGVRTHPLKALRYHTYLYYFQLLGINVGFPELIKPYDIRRGTGESVDAIASQGVLQQVMNHKDAGIFQAYINERVQCDVQAAFLGRPSADALLKATSHMSRFIDPRAPTQLDEATQGRLKSDRELVRCRQLRDNLSAECKRAFGSVKESHGSEIHAMYKDATAALQAYKVALRKSSRNEPRNIFFETVDTDEINKQLTLSLLGLEEEDWQPQKVEHRLPQRARVAELMLKQLEDPSEALENRIYMIEALIALCEVKEAQSNQKQARDHTWGIEASPKPEPTPMIYPSTQCPLCFEFFSRPRKVREHAERMHFRHYRSDTLVSCPHSVCKKLGKVFYGQDHFKNHAALKHGSRLFPKSGKALWSKL